VGKGRIVVWQGGSLWAFDVASQPAISSTAFHSHHALQLNFAVKGEFRFRVGGGIVEGPLVLVAPDVSHAYECEGQNAMVFIEPESRAGTAALRILAGRDVAQLDPAPLADLIAGLTSIWSRPRPEDSALVEIGKALTARLTGGADPTGGIDARLLRVIDRLSRSDAVIDVTQAAAIACLSESRFSHLFVEEIGLPFRTYVLWQRVMNAVTGFAAGQSLTTAAHDAGFADSAHFSRTFHRMFGLPASLLEMI